MRHLGRYGVNVDPLTQQISDQFRNSVPFSAHLGVLITKVEMGAEITAEAAMPDRPEQQNHVGGPHAGAMWTLGETASGGVVMAAFAPYLDRVVALPVTASIHFKKIARGEPTAKAHLVGGAATRDRMLAEFDAGTRPEGEVLVEIITGGVVTSSMSLIWTLVPASRA